MWSQPGCPPQGKTEETICVYVPCVCACACVRAVQSPLRGALETLDCTAHCDHWGLCYARVELNGFRAVATILAGYFHKLSFNLCRGRTFYESGDMFAVSNIKKRSVKSFSMCTVSLNMTNLQQFTQESMIFSISLIWPLCLTYISKWMVMFLSSIYPHPEIVNSAWLLPALKML